MGGPATQSHRLKLDQDGAASCTQVHHIRAGQPQNAGRKFKPIKDTNNYNNTTTRKHELPHIPDVTTCN